MMEHVAPDLDARHPSWAATASSPPGRAVGLDGAPRSRAVLLAGDAGSRQDPGAGRAARPGRGQGWRSAGRALPRLRRQRAALPPVHRAGRPAGRADPDARRALAERAPGPRRAAARPAAAVRRADQPTTRTRASTAPSCSRPCTAPSRRSPPTHRCCVVVEDLHWADRSTRDLLSFLFAGPFRSPGGRGRLLPHRRPAPAPPAAGRRGRVGAASPACCGCRCRRCPTTDVRRLVRSLHGGDLRARDCRAIVDRAEGNAFFAEELVGRRAGTSRALPDDLADLLLVRLDRLDDAGRSVVRAAACRRPPGVPRAAAPRWSTSDADALERGAARRRRVPRAGPGRRRRLRLPARAARRGGLRRPAARRAGPAARAVRRGARQPGRSTAPPPSWPGTPAPPTTSTPRCAPASGPARTRWRSAVPTRPPSTSRRRSSCWPTRARRCPTASTW